MNQNNENMNGISTVQIQSYNLMSEDMMNLEVKVNGLDYGMIIKFTPEYGVHVISMASPVGRLKYHDDGLVSYEEIDRTPIEELMIFLNLVMSLSIPLNPNIH